MNRHSRVAITDEQEAILRSAHRTHTHAELGALCGRSRTWASRACALLGLVTPWAEEQRRGRVGWARLVVISHDRHRRVEHHLETRGLELGDAAAEAAESFRRSARRALGRRGGAA